LTQIWVETRHFLERKKKYFLSIKSNHIRVISEGSCDTEDWSNENQIKKQLKKKKSPIENTEWLVILFAN